MSHDLPFLSPTTLSNEETSRDIDAHIIFILIFLFGLMDGNSVIKGPILDREDMIFSW